MGTGTLVRDVKHVGLIVFSVLVLLGIVGYTWYIEQRRVYPPDYCPTGTWPQRRAGIRIPGHTAILIDTSNRIVDEDRIRAFAAITTWARDIAPFLQRLSAYGLPESNDYRVEPSGDPFCVPKEGEDANLIYENPIFVEAEFKRFLSRLDSILRELVNREEADQSPLVEAMAELVNQREDVDSLLLVSDMLQNTPAWSHYTRRGDPAEAAIACNRITESARIKAVYVYYIDRQLEHIQSPEWPDEWWRNCLGDIETRMLNPMWAQ